MKLCHGLRYWKERQRRSNPAYLLAQCHVMGWIVSAKNRPRNAEPFCQVGENRLLLRLLVTGFNDHDEHKFP